jgi:hypothetical protein
MNFLLSEHLFTHKYDIDDILAALCGTAPCVLDTRTGTLSATAPADAPAKNIFPLEPLPESYLTEIAQSGERKHLSNDEQAILENWLQTATIATLSQHFSQGRTGGWLRERIKEAALDWLDSHDLIPPSMRHINRNKIAATTNTARSVTIESSDL